MLDIKNVSHALNDFDEDEKGGIAISDTITRNRTLATVYEAGLYRLVFKSRKPEAKRFQKWVTNEVLPSIRKWGIYPPPKAAPYLITLKPYTSRIVWVMQVRMALKPGYLCVFIEGAEILIGAEHIFGPSNLEMKQYDLLDGSMGQHWGSYRVGQPWAGNRIPYEYTIPARDRRVDGVRGAVECLDGHGPEEAHHLLRHHHGRERPGAAVP